MNKFINTLVFALLMVARTASSTPTLNYVEGWASDTAGWTYSTSDSTPGYTLVNSNGTLQLTMPVASALPEARVYASGAASAATNFIGNYSALQSSLLASRTNLWVRFNLETVNNYNTDSTAMSMYFIGNGSLYVANYTMYQPSPLNPSPTPYSFEIGSSANWNFISGINNFNAAFQDVTQFGFEFSGSTDGQDHILKLSGLELYGEAVVPEPETIWILVMVLGSLGITFRGRLGEAMKKVKASCTA